MPQRDPHVVDLARGRGHRCIAQYKTALTQPLPVFRPQHQPHPHGIHLFRHAMPSPSSQKPVQGRSGDTVTTRWTDPEYRGRVGRSGSTPGSSHSENTHMLSQKNLFARLTASYGRSDGSGTVRDSDWEVAYPSTITAFGPVPARDGRFTGTILRCTHLAYVSSGPSLGPKSRGWEMGSGLPRDFYAGIPRATA